jgi:hypothetical protein
MTAATVALIINPAILRINLIWSEGPWLDKITAMITDNFFDQTD